MGLSEIDDSDTEPEMNEEEKSPEKEEKMTYEQAAQILGVAEDEEDEAVLRKAFRKQSLLHHPDKNPNDPTATARFQKIGQALEMLTRRARGEASEDEYDAVWKSNFGRPTPSTRRASVAASARWRGNSTPSTRRRPRDCVCSMAWSFHAVDATAFHCICSMARRLTPHAVDATLTQDSHRSRRRPSSIVQEALTRGKLWWPRVRGKRGTSRAPRKLKK